MMDLTPISCLLQFRSPEGLWHARANNCAVFGHGETPEEAVEFALALAAGSRSLSPPPAPPRKRVAIVPKRRPIQGGFFG